MDFDWDAAKAAANLARHGVDFQQAAGVNFDALVLTDYSAANGETEDRLFTLDASCEGRLLPVPHPFVQEDAGIVAAGFAERLVSRRAQAEPNCSRVARSWRHRLGQVIQHRPGYSPWLLALVGSRNQVPLMPLLNRSAKLQIVAPNRGLHEARSFCYSAKRSER
jgi:uncharacterized DUF497 family protein